MGAVVFERHGRALRRRRCTGSGVAAGAGARCRGAGYDSATQPSQRPARSRPASGDGVEYRPVAFDDASRVRNRFEEEPETAARFGIYSAVIWLVTFAVIVVLVFTVGWWWAPLAFVGGFAAMMLLLARMLFAPDKKA